MHLQTAFYIIGIIFMGVMLLLLVALLAAVLVIRAKVVAIHNKVEEKLHTISDITVAGKGVFNTAKRVVGKKHG